MSPCFLRFRGVKKGSATTRFANDPRCGRRDDFPHHAWKVEYSSKPEGVGNSGSAQTGFMTAAKEPLWKRSRAQLRALAVLSLVCISGTRTKVKMFTWT